RDGQVPARPAEQRMGRHTDDDVEVARGSAVAAGGTPILDPDPLAVVHARRDPHLDLARAPLDARPPAGRARVGDDHALAAALRAGPGEGERALVVLQEARAPAAGAG